MAVRSRLLVTSLAVAAVVSIPTGWALSRLGTGDTVPADEIVLDTPGEFQEPLDSGSDPAADSGQRADRAGVGVRLPDVALLDAAGFEVRSGALIGAPAVVNVWFTTCPPCARELAEFAEVHGEVGDRVRFVGVNPFDESDQMRRFAEERGVGYELWRDTEGMFLDAVAVTSFPRTFFIDGRGAIVGEAGVLDADELRRMIEELL